MLSRIFRRCLSGAAATTLFAGSVIFVPDAAQAQLGFRDGERAVRFMTFNSFLNRNADAQLRTELANPEDPANEAAVAQIRAVAEIIQRLDPDVLLLNEFDYDASGDGVRLFQENFLEVSQNGAPPIRFDYVFNAESNTGVDSGVDIDGDGQLGGLGDAYGFGTFPGQFGMVLLSKYPIVRPLVRTFQTFLWKDMPDALLPDNADTPEPADFYSAEALDVFRLSSKSHWDIPILTSLGLVHVLAAHPTPPVFDGPEDRNGTRNHDEIRFWADYVDPAKSGYIYDDKGRMGGVRPGGRFIVMGDYNADPVDGDSTNSAISQLLNSPFFDDSLKPASAGGVEAAARQGGMNDMHVGDPAFDTGDFNPANPGNLRVDYVLPDARFRVRAAGVFWPLEADPEFRLVGPGFPVVSSDHRPVWIDLGHR